ncbi:type II toxin-antitoxin system MqsR family toxin [Allorhizobium terrae]|uniref:Type II toxin-antitoxin system MqsR family toxin n=1 Tax=Allorhizobium terrae TaxID=1848972 RepID=A0A4S3ZWI6_9HYPH|nr:type II toxin-antitoxin system MqsR family toxin [Allorhizobium terrae]THF50149.1 type II toxin-antitoxin system MqsR family toxin [Allorhizobium terrae]
MTEKKIAHYHLDNVFACIEADNVRATNSAYDGADDLGIETLDAMCAVIKKLTIKDFYKSMTTHNDRTIWQDVYRPFIDEQTQAYIKLTITNGLLIVSFKEK